MQRATRVLWIQLKSKEQNEARIIQSVYDCKEIRTMLLLLAQSSCAQSTI